MFAPSPSNQDPPTALRGIPDGYAGTAEVVRVMRDLALGAYKDERVNRLARQVTIALPRRAYEAEAGAVLRWFQGTFRYTRLPWHPDGIQRLQTPSETLFDAPTRTGECASLSTAMAAVLMSLGHEVAFRTAGTNPARPDLFEHVYVMVKVPGEGWVVADPSYEESLGWEHAAVTTVKDWPL